MFEIEIAGQMAAWFLHKHGGTMPHLKLMKLLYLAERTSVEKNGYPILGDNLVSMDYGPVLSITLDYMQGKCGEPGNGWHKWVSRKDGYEVSLVREYGSEDLDLLSDATLEVLEHVLEQCRDMNEWDAVDYTHKNCPEWRKPPSNSSIPITYKQLLCALGYEEGEAARVASELEAQQRINEALSS